MYFCPRAIVNSCTEKEGILSNESSKTVVGYILKRGEGIVELNLSFDEAVELITENNQLVDPSYSYNYFEVWIEQLENLDNTINYYLASRALVTDDLGQQVIDSYNHYFLLQSDGDNLIFSAGTQYTCNGHCCSSCTLKPAGNGQTEPYCDCGMPSSTLDCTNKARCDMSSTTTIGGNGGTN